MSDRGRIILLILAALVIVPAVFRVAIAFPAFGAHPLPYGDAINRLAPEQRHVTNTVTAVNFDYRGFDTIGEEFMLLAAVTGTVVLLRGARGEERASRPATVDGRTIPPRTEASILVSRVLAPLVFIDGCYVCLHATTTPGGGFQGGVILASTLLLIYLGENYKGWRSLVQSRVLDLFEGGGALFFIFFGFAPLALGLPFATNILPIGELKSAWSGGSMFLMNLGVSFAVFGGFGLILIEFMEETRAAKEDEDGKDAT